MSGMTGGGSGGAVLLVAPYLYGTGSIKANGGSGGGGGGRIAIKLTSEYDFDGDVELSGTEGGAKGSISSSV